jgi:NADH dehydrogenase
MSVRRILVREAALLASGARLARPALDELGCGPEAVKVTLVNRDGFHNIRVRNYESDLTPVRVSLDDAPVLCRGATRMRPLMQLYCRRSWL